MRISKGNLEEILSFAIATTAVHGLHHLAIHAPFIHVPVYWGSR